MTTKLLLLTGAMIMVGLTLTMYTAFHQVERLDLTESSSEVELLSIFGRYDLNPDTSPVNIAAFTPHDPIKINGNSGFTAANGVVSGSGTESDPYIIEGWSINSTSVDGIFISHTTSHFIIRNVLIQGNAKPPSVTLVNILKEMGIPQTADEDMISMMAMMEHSRIADSFDAEVTATGMAMRDMGMDMSGKEPREVQQSQIETQANGIFLLDVKNGVVEDATINRSNRHAILVSASDNIIIANNTISFNFLDSIRLANTNNSLISNNRVFTSGDGIGIQGISTNNIVIDNQSDKHLFCGYVLIVDKNGKAPFGNTIVNNTAAFNKWGIQLMSQFNLLGPQNNLVTGNSLTENFFHGIFLNQSHSNTIIDNISFDNTRFGILVQNSTGNNVFNNTFQGVSKGQRMGIVLTNSSRSNIIQNNIVTNNTLLGINISTNSDSNTVTMNNVTASGSAGINVEKSASFNTISLNTALGNGKFDLKWDGTGTGNVWTGNIFNTKSNNIPGG